MPPLCCPAASQVRGAGGLGGRRRASKCTSRNGLPQQSREEVHAARPAALPGHRASPGPSANVACPSTLPAPPAELGIYPAVDPLDSTSRMLNPRILGAEHYGGTSCAVCPSGMQQLCSREWGAPSRLHAMGHMASSTRAACCREMAPACAGPRCDRWTVVHAAHGCCSPPPLRSPNPPRLPSCCSGPWRAEGAAGLPQPAGHHCHPGHGRAVRGGACEAVSLRLLPARGSGGAAGGMRWAC